MVYTVLVKGMAALHASKARVLHAHYTQCSRSVHAPYTEMPECIVIDTLRLYYIIKGPCQKIWKITRQGSKIRFRSYSYGR